MVVRPRHGGHMDYVDVGYGNWPGDSSITYTRNIKREVGGLPDEYIGLNALDEKYVRKVGKNVSRNVPVNNLDKIVREYLVEEKITDNIRKLPKSNLVGYFDRYHDTGWYDRWSGDTWRDWDDWNDSSSDNKYVQKKRRSWSGDSPYTDTVSYHDYEGYYDRP